MSMTKTKIIETAYKVWGRDLYLNTSLNRVASELGVSKQALYRHFKSKQALFDAMTMDFLDNYAAFIQADYEKALKNDDIDEKIFLLIRSISEFYARDLESFIFSMTILQDRKLNNFTMVEELCVRGIDFDFFHQSIRKDYVFEPLVMRLIFASLTFYMAIFHKTRILAGPAGKDADLPDDAAITQIIKVICKIIGKGIGYAGKEIDALDYENLESRISGTVNTIEDDPLLKAVAGAVAEAGPWEASMEQVARRSGLAKSSLYGHFKSRQDMLYQLFKTESLRIIDFAKQGIRQSAVPQEQIYLGIFSMVEYLRSKPDFLVALDWIRNRRLDLTPPGEKEKGPPIEIQRIFHDIDIKPLQMHTSPFRGIGTDEENACISPWILFMVINTLMNTHPGKTLGDVPNSDIRCLYRFVTLGIGGFRNNE